MRKTVITALLALVFPLLLAVPALAQAPNFGPAVYADGQTWGTKGTTTLPAPTARNAQSYDALYMFTNGPGQLPLSEAAPGNPAYNGGRWTVVEVTWNNPAEAVVITSADDLDRYDLTFHETGTYFQCPLLPDKS